MKTNLFYLLALLFAINSFSQSNSCVKIVDDTFESGTTLSNGWTEYNTSGRVTVANGKLKFDHNTTKPSAYRTFSPTTSNSKFSFDVSASRNSVNCQINLMSSTGKYISSIAVGVITANIKYASSFRNGIPNDFTPGDPPGGLLTNTVYNVRSEIDFKSKTVSFYNNNVLMAADIPFLEDAEDIAKIDIQLIYMYSNTGQFYFDNISLLSGEENRLLLTSNTSSATTLIKTASPGSNYNQYPQTVIDAFQQAIDNANAVLNDCKSPSNTIDDAITNLQAKQEAFTAARVTGLVLSLKNDTGIIEDNLGSVIRWENQIPGYGNAIQTISALGGDQLQETYPGKVNVGFSKDGSFLELQGSTAIISDNTYSFFYVGKANPVGEPASLIGNYDIPGDFSKCSGIRFVKLEDGRISFDYATPNYVRIDLGTIPGNGYFFFGFTMDVSGNYSYFDSNSSIIKTGKISTAMVANTEQLKFNLFEEKDGPNTYNQTEVVEFSMYDAQLNTSDFQAQFDRLKSEYSELVTIVPTFLKVDSVLPSEHLNISKTGTIALTCNQNIDINSVMPKVFVNKGTSATAGTWNLTDPKTLTFTPSQNWPLGALVSLQIQAGLLSTDGGKVDISKRFKYDFIVETESKYGASQNIDLAAIATVDFPQVGHTLGMKLNLPTNRTEKTPVHFWVHGGGWSGGTAAASAGSTSPHGEYLAENLGIATLGIAYRCSGSSGTFSLAMEDVATAYQWALANADKYNFDMTKVFFSGGSAGAPEAALASQRYPSVIGFIGFNGIYDFVNDAGDFGNTNWYKQNVPSETLNSAFFQLRSNPPATIMMHGDADTTISYKQSTLFAAKINANGGTATAVIYPGEVHAFFNPGQPAYEDVLWEMANFMSKTLQKESLGVNEVPIKDKTKLTVYPNPVKKGELLKLQFNSNFNEKNVQIKIVNLLGQVVYNTIAHFDQGSNNCSIDIRNLKEGHYILKASEKSISETLKFIIN